MEKNSNYFSKFIFSKISIISFFIVGLFLVSSCENSSTTQEAKKAKVDDMLILPGFAWFDEAKRNYVFDTLVVEQIKNYNNKQKLFLFVKPSCSCDGTKRTFPHFIKVLEQAGLSQNDYELYFMSNEEDKHPYMNEIKIKDLPGFYYKKTDGSYYSIVDTLSDRLGKNLTFKIEDILLEAAKQ